MQGFVRRKIPVWVRRLVTTAPALIVIAIGLDPTRTLVISQVVLSFGLPFAIVPLLMFTAKQITYGPAYKPVDHHGAHDLDHHHCNSA